MATRPPSRLLVSHEVADSVESTRIELLIKTRREWTKTAINDALVKVALQHLDEVAALLTEESPDV